MLSLDRLLASIDDADLSHCREIAGWTAAAIMHDWLDHVLGEARPDRRRRAIDQLFAADCILVTPDEGLRGRHALASWTEQLRSRHPFSTFSPADRVVAHNGMACLNWTFGSPGRPATAAGTDLALLEGERIRALYRFPTPSTAAKRRRNP